MPTCARTRSAKPGGAFTAPSRFRSVVKSIIVISSEKFQPAMDVRLHRSHRLTQRLRHLRVREVANMAEHNGLSIADRELGDARRQLSQLHAFHGLRLRAWRMVGLAAVQLDETGFHAPDPVPDYVDRDPVQPRPLLQIADALGRVSRERAIGAKERVLRHLLRVMAVAGPPQAGGGNAGLWLVPHPPEKTAHTPAPPPPTHTSSPPT